MVYDIAPTVTWRHYSRERGRTGTRRHKQEPEDAVDRSKSVHAQFVGIDMSMNMAWLHVH